LVTIFKDFSETTQPHYISVEAALARIKQGKSKESIELLRQGKFDKMKLPSVLWSASATKPVSTEKVSASHRTDESVTEHSGFFILDFDEVDVNLKSSQLKTDPFVYAVWLSPSGNGVKALVKCPASVENHRLYYTAFLDRYPELDSTSRNVSRVTFESYDPNLWLNRNSLIWDKKLTEEQRKANKDKEANRRGTKVISTAVGIVRSSYQGTKHDALIKASNLLGGYIATGRVDESEAIKILTEEIKAKNPKDLSGAIQTIKDGIAFGKTRPLHETKKIEKAQQFLRRDDGSFQFLADQEEMDEYLKALIGGYLEHGLPLINGLNPHFMLKKHTMVFFAGTDGVGKSFLVWYLSVLAAMLHGWKIIIHSAENGDGELSKKLMEFYLGKSCKLMDDEELTIARDFVKTHFRIVSSTQMHTLEDFLLKCEIVIDEGFEAQLVIGEPFNSFDVPFSIDTYRSNIHSLNISRVFKEQYCSLWYADHVNSTAGRSKDSEGFVLPPSKADIEGGIIKNNKTDDFIIVHRLGNHPFKRMETQIHVAKIKSTESGGFVTNKDEPVILTINENYCGYSCNGIDTVAEYWKNKKR